MVIVGPFLVPRREAPKLFEAVDQPLNSVALPVECPIKRSPTPLVRFPGDRHADASPPQKAPNLAAAVPLIAHDSLRTQLGSSPSHPFDCPVFHQPFKRCRFMPLARRQHNRHRFPVPIGTEVDFGAEAALAATQRFGFWVPFFAPAACWWARTTVAST